MTQNNMTMITAKTPKSFLSNFSPVCNMLKIRFHCFPLFTSWTMGKEKLFVVKYDYFLQDSSICIYLKRCNSLAVDHTSDSPIVNKTHKIYRLQTITSPTAINPFHCEQASKTKIKYKYFPKIVILVQSEKLSYKYWQFLLLRKHRYLN